MKQTQRYVRYGHVGLLVCSSTRLEDVPAAETFLVEDAVSVSKIRISKAEGRKKEGRGKEGRKNEEEGRKEERKRGRKEGREEGRKRGWKEGRNEKMMIMNRSCSALSNICASYMFKVPPISPFISSTTCLSIYISTCQSLQILVSVIVTPILIILDNNNNNNNYYYYIL